MKRLKAMAASLLLAALLASCASSDSVRLADSGLTAGEASAGRPFKTLSRSFRDHVRGCWRGFTWTTGTLARQTEADFDRMVAFFR
jgi:hypothetical protein